MMYDTVNPLARPSYVTQIVSVYRLAFGGKPWNEGYLCPRCQAVVALEHRDAICPVCRANGRSVLLVEYWPVSKVTLDFYAEMEKPGALCAVAHEMDCVFAFAWGYLVRAGQELDVHLEAEGLHNVLEGDFFYLDECAVHPAAQGQGMGKNLVRYIFGQQPQKKVLLRTMDNSRMCSLIKHMGGEIMQKISRDRVIMQLRVR